MRRSKVRKTTPTRERIPRMRAAEAAQILEKLDTVLESSREVLKDLRRTGVGELLNRLDDKMLQLAIQPDSWGERTRACLVSYIAPALSADSTQQSVVNIEEIAGIANLVMPCLLLEFGRRRQYVQVQFPSSPTDPQSAVTLRAGPSHPVHSISNQRLAELVTVAGEALVGLCYFGDQASRAQIEAELSLKDVGSTKSRPCRTSQS